MRNFIESAGQREACAQKKKSHMQISMQMSAPNGAPQEGAVELKARNVDLLDRPPDEIISMIMNNQRP